MVETGGEEGGRALAGAHCADVGLESRRVLALDLECELCTDHHAARGRLMWEHMHGFQRKAAAETLHSNSPSEPSE